jgi:hypothetical protein
MSDPIQELMALKNLVNEKLIPALIAQKKKIDALERRVMQLEQKDDNETTINMPAV